MNIAIAYHHSPLEESSWGTPQGIEAYLKKEHFVQKYLLDPKNCNFDKLLEDSKRYDLILIFYAGPSDSFDSELIKLKQNTKTKIFLELGDEPQTFHHNQKRINYVDAFFTPDLRCHNFYKSKGYNSYWMTHWCDDSIFYHNPEIKVNNVCITTCGSRPPYTDLLPKYLGNKFINKRVDNNENNSFYNSGTIVFQNARWDEITRRIFEGGGCKKAVLTNRIHKDTGIYELFKEDEDICYYSNEVECLNKIAKLLHDEEYRNKLANNIYKKITENHLTKHRIEMILGALRK